MDRDLLGTYLNDHLAAATMGRELAKRAVGQNRGTRYERFLQAVCVEIDEDREALLDVMRRLGIDESKVKVAGGFIAERVGRLKLNNRLVGYSPLSRLVEMEALSGGVHGKLSLWQVLSASAAGEPALEGVDFARLEERARTQLEGLEKHRLDAGREALAGQPAAAGS